MAPLTIWSNISVASNLASDLERRVAPHRLLWAANRSASNLTSGASDPALVELADIALGQPSVEDLFAATKLKLVILNSAGYTRYDRPDLRAHCDERGIAVCNASAVYADPCAQHLLACMLAAARRLPEAVTAQNAFRGWDSFTLRKASVLLGPGATVVIAGYGSIARRLVELLMPFGMSIRAFRRAPKGDENCPTSPIDEIDQHLPHADHVVNILPLGDSTTRFFDATRLSRMKRGANFYNIGRGDTVDQPALVNALVSGQLAQAYLDVTTPEPLPPNDPLWTTPNCHITPHTAGGSNDEPERQISHFVENVKRFARGDAVVDRVF